MPSLSKDLRNLLARTTLSAREHAEQAVRAALENLAVHEREYRPHMSVEQRHFRNRLRERGRAAGDERAANGYQQLDHLVAEAAYEHWHRLLFTRFLTENGLLRTDAANGNVPVTLDDCDELALELGARNGFELACRFAGDILPGVFRKDDPVLDLRLAPNDEVALKTLLDELPVEVFTADDSLGWTYQFWQAKRKDEVNAGGKKIGAEEISPVTQLFTEDYMVEFLLHNTLGAWWAGKHSPVYAGSEAEARRSVALEELGGLPAIDWTFLRFIEDTNTGTWRPAVGVSQSWPQDAKSITVLDPCMGSGHFLVFALPIIARLRMKEEGLSAEDAVSASLGENIYGLELDPRCTQIGAFNLALTAWKLAGFQRLPELQIACSGLAPQARLVDWVKLAGDDARLQEGMRRLYKLFEQAPMLGSLVDPREEGDLLSSSFNDLQPLLEEALRDENADDSTHEMAVTAKGIAAASDILASQFTLVVTNVPYLGRGNQDESLRRFSDRYYPQAKADLATVFLLRTLMLCAKGGATALVTPQNWLFLSTYKRLREDLLKSRQWNMVARLGAKGFQTPMWDFNVQLGIISASPPDAAHLVSGIDVSNEADYQQKAEALSVSALTVVSQQSQLGNPDARITLEVPSQFPLLQDLATANAGIQSGDNPRFGRCFWEISKIDRGWTVQLSTVASTSAYSKGREHILFWEDGEGELAKSASSYIRGSSAWGRRGVLVSQMNRLPTCLYDGELFDNNSAAIVPSDPALLPAIWALCESADFYNLVRGIDQKINVTNATLVKIPFDLAYWKKVGAEAYPTGMPKPESNDATQWIFNGHPRGSHQSLQVAVARLLGYHWPRQTGSSFSACPQLDPDGLEVLADKDGIVCLPAINQEQPAASRLRQLLATALGDFDERSLIAASGGTSTRLEEWIRDEFFELHCKLFHHRPFIWHIWDGRKDGFHALVNYHQLDHAALQKLTYSYLGDWIRFQEDGAKTDMPGAAERLGAAKVLQKELAKIIEGEAPYDIFVRWKPIGQQAIGWNPDLNNGVRLNIRPFLLANDVGKKGAGLLRWKPNIKWEKDRGSEPRCAEKDYPWFWCSTEPTTDPGGGRKFTGYRWNDVHLTLGRKQQAQG